MLKTRRAYGMPLARRAYGMLKTRRAYGMLKTRRAYGMKKLLAKRICSSLLVLITLFTASVGLASSLEDKMTSALWINKDTNEACEFFRKDGNLTCSINKFSKGYLTMQQDFESQVVVLNDNTIFLALNLFEVSFDELDWGGGTGVIMTLYNESDGMTLSFYTHKTAVFDEVI